MRYIFTNFVYRSHDKLFIVVGGGGGGGGGGVRLCQKVIEKGNR